MPPIRTHNENRSLVCLICFKKGSSMKKSVGVALSRVKKYFKEDFDPSNQELPSSICARCRKSLINVEKGKPADLDDPIDFLRLRFPVLTRKFGGINDLGNLKNCPCSICIIARHNPGQKDNKFGGRTKQEPYPLGRPSIENIQRLPFPKPIKICKRCRIVIGKGLPHPQPCTLSDRRASLENIFEADSTGLEIAASAIIRQKVSESSMNISTIKLATRGHSMTLSKPGSSSRTKKALFQDIPIPASEISHLKTVCKFSHHQAEQTVKFVRTWKGRKSIESGALDKLREDDKAQVNFFTTKKCFMDSSNKSERMDEKKVERTLVYCHDISGLIDHIYQHRELSQEDRYYIKIGIDGGRSFLKVCLNLEKYDNFTSQDNQNKKMVLCCWSLFQKMQGFRC